MNKLRPRNKICFQNNKNLHLSLKLYKLRKKKWSLFKKKSKYRKEIKPEKKKNFFQARLFETQNFRTFYGCIPKYQLKNILKKLLKKTNKINLFNNFLFSLESRIDVNIVRLKLAKTIFHAKQLINHKKIKINNKIINKSNMILRKGDLVNIIL